MSETTRNRFDSGIEGEDQLEARRRPRCGGVARSGEIVVKPSRLGRFRVARRASEVGWRQ